jgi:hypothetical protein
MWCEVFYGKDERDGMSGPNTVGEQATSHGVPSADAISHSLLHEMLTSSTRRGNQ